ncbi:type IV pilus assembly PilZ [Desulforamulus reducens MI-1]|uniref:Type IV pilus assembly PilZ n=1 Tax=Desulforamulus reducens (strain ATCC BAA-1160 / DSM 100696 / MI-1) TaxID=349161 RepID=A4J730_DESRM|nr:PilZ domain-containing protein [Desulforamulus reducens]ABO50883.1 type IV pilus assembly PilZ [Desulforamulus reducens MI-1]
MNSDQGQLEEGSRITICDLSSRQEFTGQIVADYGTYLVVNPEQDPVINPGQQIKVGMSNSQNMTEFNSYICFLDNDLNKHFCIYVPPDLGQKKRRKYLRLAIELNMIYRASGLEINTKTINVSAGGLYFFTPERLVDGQDIELELFLPDNTITIGAKVLRTMQNAASVEFYEELEKIHILASYLYSCSLMKHIQEE